MLKLFQSLSGPVGAGQIDCLSQDREASDNGQNQIEETDILSNSAAYRSRPL